MWKYVLTHPLECDKIGAIFCGQMFQKIIQIRGWQDKCLVYNNIHIQEEEIMKKETNVEKTKAVLVKEVEQKFRLKKGTLDSLERANKETIVKLLSL